MNLLVCKIYLCFFKQNELEPNLLIKDFCENLFLNYLNFYATLRFTRIFTHEGL